VRSRFSPSRAKTQTLQMLTSGPRGRTERKKTRLRAEELRVLPPLPRTSRRETSPSPSSSAKEPGDGCPPYYWGIKGEKKGQEKPGGKRGGKGRTCRKPKNLKSPLQRKVKRIGSLGKIRGLCLQGGISGSTLNVSSEKRRRGRKKAGGTGARLQVHVGAHD